MSSSLKKRGDPAVRDNTGKPDGSLLSETSRTKTSSAWHRSYAENLKKKSNSRKQKVEWRSPGAGVGEGRMQGADFSSGVNTPEELMRSTGLQLMMLLCCRSETC